jgi:hypothetical protein
MLYFFFLTHKCVQYENCVSMFFQIYLPSMPGVSTIVRLFSTSESVSEPSNRERKVPPNSLKGEYQKMKKICFLVLTSRRDTLKAKEARNINITEHHKYMHTRVQ